MRITTNHIPRDLLSLDELPAHIQPDFDYLEDDQTPRLVLFKGWYYDAYDTQTIVVSDEHTKPVGWASYVKAGDPLAAWDALAGDSFFSGTLFKFTLDDRVIVGTYTC